MIGSHDCFAHCSLMVQDMETIDSHTEWREKMCTIRWLDVISAELGIAQKNWKNLLSCPKISTTDVVWVVARAFNALNRWCKSPYVYRRRRKAAAYYKDAEEMRWMTHYDQMRTQPIPLSHARWGTHCLLRFADTDVSNGSDGEPSSWVDFWFLVILQCTGPRNVNTLTVPVLRGGVDFWFLVILQCTGPRNVNTLTVPVLRGGVDFWFLVILQCTGPRNVETLTVPVLRGGVDFWFLVIQSEFWC